MSSGNGALVEIEHLTKHFPVKQGVFARGNAVVHAVEDVSLMSRIVRDKGLGVKASGGVRSLADLIKMVAAGATRIGTSSGLKILKEAAGEVISSEGAKY